MASLRNAKNTMAGMTLQGGLLMLLLAHNRDWFSQVSSILFNFQTKASSNGNDSQQGNLLQHLHNVRESLSLLMSP